MLVLLGLGHRLKLVLGLESETEVGKTSCDIVVKNRPEFEIVDK